jgi:hypothetical protein
MSKAIEDVIAERKRQVEVEGFTTDHDDAYMRGELAKAAACYALKASGLVDTLAQRFWPWTRDWWKPKDPRANLVRAAALVIAEIERLDRQADKAGA